MQQSTLKHLDVTYQLSIFLSNLFHQTCWQWMKQCDAYWYQHCDYVHVHQMHVYAQSIHFVPIWPRYLFFLSCCNNGNCIWCAFSDLDNTPIKDSTCFAPSLPPPSFDWTTLALSKTIWDSHFCHSQSHTLITPCEGPCEINVSYVASLSNNDNGNGLFMELLDSNTNQKCSL